MLCHDELWFSREHRMMVLTLELVSRNGHVYSSRSKARLRRGAPFNLGSVGVVDLGVEQLPVALLQLQRESGQHVAGILDAVVEVAHDHPSDVVLSHLAQNGSANLDRGLEGLVDHAVLRLSRCLADVDSAWHMQFS